MESKFTVARQRFGSHLSVAGGLHLAFDEARRLGCDCLQIFVKNQRQWNAKPLSEAAICNYKAAAARHDISPVFAHASYLLNAASPDSTARMKSIHALIDELERCEALGLAGLVLHPGAHLGEGIDAGIARIAASIDQAHAATSGFSTRILLESTAGQGTTIGHELGHLSRIIGAVRAPDRLGICLDTCHLFAAGYDLRKPGEYERTMGELAVLQLLPSVRCIHVNDSKGDCGSRLDRHEHIGKGRIGRDGFANLVNDSRLAHIPRILETPKEKNARGIDLDLINLRKLRSWIITIQRPVTRSPAASRDTSTRHAPVARRRTRASARSIRAPRPPIPSSPDP